MPPVYYSLHGQRSHEWAVATPHWQLGANWPKKWPKPNRLAKWGNFDGQTIAFHALTNVLTRTLLETSTVVVEHVVYSCWPPARPKTTEISFFLQTTVANHVKIIWVLPPSYVPIIKKLTLL